MLPLKYAVPHIGLQPDQTWVLGSIAYFSPEGKQIPESERKYVWIRDFMAQELVPIRNGT